MKLDQVANSGNDEFYTPRYAVLPLLRYVPVSWRVWCPFDTEDSLIVRVLREHGNAVTATHLSHGEDFFSITRECDVVISNPPYSVKGPVFERLYSLDKPFAMLVGVVGLFESESRFNIFSNNAVEIMWLSKRVSYFRSYADQKPALNPPFSSVWATSRVLPCGNVFARINKKGEAK